MKNHSAQLDVEHLRARLKLKSFQSEGLLKAHHPQAANLLQSTGIRPGRLRSHAAKVLTSTMTLASLVLPPVQLTPNLNLPSQLVESSPVLPSTEFELRSLLNQKLPPQSGRLSPDLEQQIISSVKHLYGLNVTTELDGNRLNTDFGYIGAEQHLPRFPGDSSSQHDQFQSVGLTPGRGAWGYFAKTKSDLTPDLIAKEKYYFAVQTLYLPDWSTRLAYLRDWYKYRKMMAINPVNGKVIIGVVADSGPAWWTGKSYGGSPEIMAYLNLKDGRQKGQVIVLFVNDPQNTIPLGPLQPNQILPYQLLSSQL